MDEKLSAAISVLRDSLVLISELEDSPVKGSLTNMVRESVKLLEIHSATLQKDRITRYTNAVVLTKF
jgi:hypothetical protein